MTNQEFIHEMQPIIRIFGPAEYAPDRMMLIFEDVADLPASSLRWIVKMFCKDRSVKHPPLPKDFNTAAHEQRKKIKEFAINDAVENLEDQRGPEKLKEIFKSLGVHSLDEALAKHNELPGVQEEGA